MIRNAPFYFMNPEPAFSVVVPIFNEGENVAAVCLELQTVLTVRVHTMKAWPRFIVLVATAN